MPMVLNMRNSLQPRLPLFVLTALIDTLYLLFLKNLETGSDRIVLDSIYCLLLLETPFPFLPINLLPINSKRKNYRIPTIYSKIFLFVMNLAWFLNNSILWILCKTLDKVHALLGLKKNKDYFRETRTKALKNKLNKLKYRTHLIDSFNLRSNSM